ncbi:MAG: hypothetical protein GX303_02455 [Clostridiales bacterium]|nr:hypothetical protein [Clostridiales bacterium]
MKSEDSSAVQKNLNLHNKTQEKSPDLSAIGRFFFFDPPFFQLMAYIYPWLLSIFISGNKKSTGRVKSSE